jgi:hypothetical protein
MPRALDLPGKVALAARAVPSLAAGANFANLGDIALQCVNIFIVEAFAIRAIIGLAWPTATTASAKATGFPSTTTAVAPASLI